MTSKKKRITFTVKTFPGQKSRVVSKEFNCFAKKQYIHFGNFVMVFTDKGIEVSSVERGVINIRVDQQTLTISQ